MTAEQFIKDYTNYCSNEFVDGGFHEWLTPEQALRAVELARQNLWHPADGDDLPEIDREVIALVGLEGFFEIPPDEPVKLSYKVVFAHRPPEYWDGKNILTGKVTRNYTKRYDKGGWNQPDVKWWLDLDLPKMQE